MQRNERQYDISVQVLEFSDSISTTNVSKTDNKFYEVDRPNVGSTNAKSFDKHVAKHSHKSTSHRPTMHHGIPDHSSNTQHSTGGVTSLLHQIAHGEGVTSAMTTQKGYASPYDVTLDYGAYCDDKTKPITQMTIAEIKVLQKTILNHPDNKLNSSAVGYYQIVGMTLAYLQRKMKFGDTVIFNKELQDAMGVVLLERRGLQKFKSGTKGVALFQQDISKEWDSVAFDSKNRNYKNTHRANTTTEILAPHFENLITERSASRKYYNQKSTTVSKSTDTSINYYQQYVTPSPSVKHANKGLHCPNSSWMLREFGRPGKNISSRPDNSKLFKKYRMPTKDVGPFRVTGFPPFIDVLKLVFSELKTTHPELYDYIQSDGMQACRKSAGASTALSSHSWGHALDIKVGSKRSKYGYKKHLRAFEVLIPLMNKYKIFSGITFGKMDSMHFQVSKELYKMWVDNGNITYGNGTFSYSNEPVPRPEPDQDNSEIETNPANNIAENDTVNPGSVGRVVGSGKSARMIANKPLTFITRNRTFTEHTFIPEYIQSYDITTDFINHIQVHTLVINNVSVRGFDVLSNQDNIIKVVTSDQSGVMGNKEQFLTVKQVDIIGREDNDTYILKLSCFGTMVDRLLNQGMYSIVMDNATPYQVISKIMDNIGQRFETSVNMKTNSQGLNHEYEQIFIPSKTVFEQLSDTINGVYKLNEIPTEWVLVDTNYNDFMRPSSLTLVLVDTHQMDRMDKTKMESLSPNGINLSSLQNTRSIVDPGVLPMLFQSNISLTQANGQTFFKQKTAIVEGFKSSGDGGSTVVTHEIPATMTLDVKITDDLDHHNGRMVALKTWTERNPSISVFKTSNVDITKLSPCEAYSFANSGYDYTMLDYTIRFTRNGDEQKHLGQFHSAALTSLLFHFRD